MSHTAVADTPLHPVARRQEIFAIVRRIYRPIDYTQDYAWGVNRLTDLSPTEAELNEAMYVFPDTLGYGYG